MADRRLNLALTQAEALTAARETAASHLTARLRQERDEARQELAAMKEAHGHGLAACFVAGLLVGLCLGVFVVAAVGVPL